MQAVFSMSAIFFATKCDSFVCRIQNYNLRHFLQKIVILCSVCLIAIMTSDVCAKLTNELVAETSSVLPTNPGHSVDPELQAVPKWQVPECLGCQNSRQNTALYCKNIRIVKFLGH